MVLTKVSVSWRALFVRGNESRVFTANFDCDDDTIGVNRIEEIVETLTKVGWVMVMDTEVTIVTSK